MKESSLTYLLILTKSNLLIKQLETPQREPGRNASSEACGLFIMDILYPALTLVSYSVLPLIAVCHRPWLPCNKALIPSTAIFWCRKRMAALFCCVLRFRGQKK